MTNIEIIASARTELAANGKIRTTVKDGITVPAENIYTKNAWKKLGYHVRKEESPLATVPIWVYCKGENPEMRMCRVNAHFYKADQVVAI